MSAFREWFAKRHPGCNGYTKSHEHVWFGKAGEDQAEAMLRLADAVAIFLDEADRRLAELEKTVQRGIDPRLLGDGLLGEIARGGR